MPILFITSSPPIRLRSRNNRQLRHSSAAISAMQSHGGKTCPCHCVARILPWVFFHCKLVHICMHSASIKKTISVAPIVSLPPPSNPDDTTPLPLCPYSHRPPERGVYTWHACAQTLALAGGGALTLSTAPDKAWGGAVLASLSSHPRGGVALISFGFGGDEGTVLHWGHQKRHHAPYHNKMSHITLPICFTILFYPFYQVRNTLLYNNNA